MTRGKRFSLRHWCVNKVYKMRPKNVPTGFTLIEILLVIAILCMLAAMAVPMLTGQLEAQRLKSAAEAIRSECREARVRAMQDGQILCLRMKLGTGEYLIDRILDAHFTASLSSRESNDLYRLSNEYDPFELGNFTGRMEDFILRDPDSVAEENGGIVDKLPETISVVDVIVVPDERAAFYLGLTAPGEMTIEENMAEAEGVSNRELNLGETGSRSGSLWSAPVFFYPDGATSTAAFLLKSERGRCVEIRLRGLTGSVKIFEATTVNAYTGELTPDR